MRVVIGILLFNLLLRNAFAERILVLAPMIPRSHMHSMTPMIEALAERGHQLTVVAARPPDTDSPNVHSIVLKELIDYIETKWYSFQRESPLEFISNVIGQFRVLFTAGYRSLMSNEEFRSIVFNKTVDLVIVDAILQDFTLPIIDHLGVPFIFYSPAAGIPWVLDAMNAAQEYALVPATGTDFSSRMTLLERTINTFMGEGLLAMRRWFVLSMVDDLAKEDFPNVRRAVDIERDAQLCFVNIHPATSWPRSLPPTFIPVGALHVRPPKQLPQSLRQFADEAEDGFIVFTLGSNAQVSSMPENIVNIFARVFSRLSQRVFWKWETNNFNDSILASNIMMVDWLPQQDLLGHEKARLFISHGGLLGKQEALYHAVPVLGLPLGRDQPGNLVRAEEEGFGIKLNWENLSEELLYDSIQEILNNPSYRGNATRLSRLMRDELVPAKDIAVYWVEHVLRHGETNHLKQRNIHGMPFYQLYLLDVWLVIVSLFGVTVYFTFKICRLVGLKLLSLPTTKTVTKLKSN